MKRLFLAVVFAAALVAIPARAEEQKLGKPVTLKATPIEHLLMHPDQYLGKEVAVEGEITEVCQHMACWIEVRGASGKQSIRVKVDDGVIEFPKDGAGRKVVAQGVLEKIEMTREQYVAQLHHEAEETGRTIDTSKITEGKTTYRIKGEGAVIR